MPKWVAGNELSSEARAQVLASYVNRWTFENERNVRQVRAATRNAVPLVTDAEWIAAHCFLVRKDGRLSETVKHCRPVYMAGSNA